MKGDDRKRFCEQCNLHVYNIAEMTRREVASLVRITEGKFCGRIYRRADGTIITKDCPVGLRALRRRVAKTAGAVFATVISLCAVVMGQKPAKESACRPQVTASKKKVDSLPAARAIAGTVIDPNGAVIAGAKVEIVDSSQKIFETQSNDEGWFLVSNLEPGLYEVTISAAGFKRLRLHDVKLPAKEAVNFELALEVAGNSVTVGMIGEPSLIETHPDMTIFSGDLIRRLPH